MRYAHDYPAPKPFIAMTSEGALLAALLFRSFLEQSAMALIQLSIP